MNQNTIAAALSVCFFSIYANAGPFDAASTGSKLDTVSSLFRFSGYKLSDELLGRWRSKSGLLRILSANEVKNRYVTEALAAQRDIIIAGMKRDLALGKYTPGKTYNLPSLERSVARPTGPSDWTYAIGGWTIDTFYSVSLSKKDSKGYVTCSIPSWSSTVYDVYRFDATDAYSVLFKQGELSDYATKGYAKDFVVGSVGFEPQTKEPFQIKVQ